MKVTVWEIMKGDLSAHAPLVPSLSASFRLRLPVRADDAANNFRRLNGYSKTNNDSRHQKVNIKYKNIILFIRVHLWRFVVLLKGNSLLLSLYLQ